MMTKKHSRSFLLWLGIIAISISIGIKLTQAQNEAKPIAENPELELKVKEITQELRCLVCQNESIADSHADLANDLRNQVRDKLVQNQSKQQIIDYMVARYGDFVLYKPPLKASTWALWLSPFLLIVIGFLVLRKQIIGLRSTPPAQMTAEEIAKAQALLKSSSSEHEKESL